MAGERRVASQGGRHGHGEVAVGQRSGLAVRGQFRRPRNLSNKVQLLQVQERERSRIQHSSVVLPIIYTCIDSSDYRPGR